MATLTAGAVAAVTMAAVAVPAGAASPFGSVTLYHQTNLVSNLSTVGAQVVDPSLQNSWGLAMSATSPLWVSDNNSGLATIYSIPAGGTSVTKAGLTVTVQGGRTSTNDGSSPTGQVFNPTTGFVVTGPAGSGPALFIFDSESGQISAWSPKADPANALVQFSSPTAVYKGLAIAATDQGTFLYAANFNAGTVDVFNSTFQQVNLLGNFHDPFMPSGYAPFGIQEINGLLYVTYALQDAAKHDDVAGPGFGFVDIFTTNGLFVKRLASRGVLNAPWGLAQAPASFGSFGGDLLVGNFGNGWINAYNPITGRFAGTMFSDQHKPVSIDGLWGLAFGTASTGGTNTLLFSSGPDNQNDGLLGSINPAP
ncbi:MAG: TIGR03118 family protein [Streptosporangiaceae bacterium]|nr:TIGR03118 family protein [Streptosporangiaceae bacterium]